MLMSPELPPPTPAVAAHREALEVFEAGGATYYAEVARSNLARAEALLAKRRGGAAAE